jgi:hypothetical protein
MKSGLPIVDPELVALADRLEAAQLEYLPSDKAQVCSGSFLEFYWCDVYFQLQCRFMPSFDSERRGSSEPQNRGGAALGPSGLSNRTEEINVAALKLRLKKRANL